MEIVRGRPCWARPDSRDKIRRARIDPVTRPSTVVGSSTADGCLVVIAPHLFDDEPVHLTGYHAGCLAFGSARGRPGPICTAREEQLVQTRTNAPAIRPARDCIHRACWPIRRIPRPRTHQRPDARTSDLMDGVQMRAAGELSRAAGEAMNWKEVTSSEDRSFERQRRSENRRQEVSDDTTGRERRERFRPVVMREPTQLG